MRRRPRRGGGYDPGNGPSDRTVDTAMRKTRICFPFAGDVVGGSHISALGLLQHLDRNRFEPVLMLERADGAIAGLMREADAEIVSAPPTVPLRHGERLGMLQTIKLAAAAPMLRATVRALGAHIVHTNDGRTHATWALPSRIAGARLVWHHRGAPDALGLRFASPWLADAVISVSRFAFGKAAFAGPRRHVIHSPFDTDLAIDRADRRARLVGELGCDPTTRLLGYFGLLTARKRPMLFVETISAMRARRPDVPVMGLIFGESFDVSIDTVMAYAAELGCADSIRYMGYRAPGADWLAACDLLVIPAVDEPFGRTLIEAMLVGTPVLATRSGGNVEALREGSLGVLVDPENPIALARAAIDLMIDPARCRSYTDRAREDARRRFGNRRHADAVMAVYDEVLRAHRRRETGAIITAPVALRHRSR